MESEGKYLKDKYINSLKASREKCSEECLKVELTVLQQVLSSQHRPIDELQLEEVLAVLQEETKKIEEQRLDCRLLHMDMDANPVSLEEEP